MVIAQSFFLINDIALDIAADCCPFWKPHRQALSDFLRIHEQVKLFADFTMITLFRFLKETQMLGQVFFLKESCSINALKHLIVTVASPVGASNT